MKIIVIGAVAAGTKAAAKIKRELGNEAEVLVITRERDISYAGCGLPYYIGGVIEDRSELLQNTPESFAGLTGVTMRCGVEAKGLDAAAKAVTAVDLESGEELRLEYDKLVIATGARPVMPNIPGIDLPGVFALRNPSDADAVLEAVNAGMKRAVIVGGGLIGVEMAENLSKRGVRVSIIDMAPHILPGFDADFADYVENLLADNGIPVFLGDGVTEIEGTDKVTKLRTAKRGIKTDAVIMSVGVRPNTEWLAGSGIELAKNGSIVVDDYMRTNIEDVYARERAKDELPQSGSGRTIMTAEPKFVPEDAGEEPRDRQGHVDADGLLGEP